MKWRCSTSSPLSLRKLNCAISDARPASSHSSFRWSTPFVTATRTPPRPQHPCQLGQGAVDVGQVVEHPRRNGGVELGVAERKRLHVADAGVDALRTLYLDHRLGLVDADQLHAELTHDPLGQLTLPTADLEHPSRFRGSDRVEGELPRIVALGVFVGRLARLQIVGRRVLLPDERLVVDAQRRAALGSGSSSSAAISSRIFSSDRRISRETCICEMPTCCAICDWVSPSKKRRWRLLRSRSSTTRNPGASTARPSDTSY